jgi:hypothetical protein
MTQNLLYVLILCDPDIRICGVMYVRRVYMLPGLRVSYLH